MEVFLGTFSGVPPKKHLSYTLIAWLLRKTNIGIEREGVKLRLAKTGIWPHYSGNSDLHYPVGIETKIGTRKTASYDRLQAALQAEEKWSKLEGILKVMKTAWKD